MQEIPIKSNDPTYEDQVVKFYNKPIHNTAVYFAVLMDGTARIFIQRSVAIKATKNLVNEENPNFQVLKSHYYFQGIELDLVRSDEGVNISKYQYEILPDTRDQIIPATVIHIPPADSDSDRQTFLPFEKTITYHENFAVGNDTALRTRRDVYYIEAMIIDTLI